MPRPEPGKSNDYLTIRYLCIGDPGAGIGMPRSATLPVAIAAPQLIHDHPGHIGGGPRENGAYRDRQLHRVATVKACRRTEQTFSMLFMRSTGRIPDDLTARARIRDAAVELIGLDGFENVKIRAVAEKAGVSPGLVIHHFGCKDGLRAECEQYVGDRIHEAIEQATANLQPYDLLGEMSKKLELAPLVPYLIRALAEGGDLGRRMFARMVDDTERYLRAAVTQGTIRPSEDERGRAEMLTSFSLGSQLLAQYLVSADTPEGRVQELQQRFTVPALEVFTQGLYTSTDILTAYRDQLADSNGEFATRSGDRPHRTEPNAPAGDPPARE